MDWATGIGIDGGKLTATFSDKDGRTTFRNLSSLVSDGVPTIAKLQRKGGLTTDFSSWKTVHPSSYAAVFDLDAEVLLLSEHKIYEFQCRETKVQVPALVVMRALFYPARHLLETMFRPQALDAVAFFDNETVYIDSSLKKGGYSWASDAVRSSLRWMYSFPTAFRMAHSVHEHAMRGRLGLVLPDASVKVSVSGKKVGDTYYATEMSFTKIFALEQTFEHLPKMPLLVFETIGSQAKPADTTIPIGAYGLELCDDEWNEVAPVLLAKTRPHQRARQRELFDAVLKKLYTATPWRKMTYEVGNYVDASQAYRVWKEGGTFEPALELLRTLRQTI
jgi:hypothetical protein